MEHLRIAEERKKLGLSQEELAKKIGVSQKSISKYERGTRRPTYETLTAMSAIFGVSVDYLLGNDISDKSISNDKYFFFFFDCWDECLERIKYRLRELGILESDFCTELNVDLNKEISISDLKSIASRLDVSTDYLLGVSDIENVSSADILFAQSLSVREKDIIESFRLLNKDNQDIMVGELKKCLKEQRYESVAADEIPSKKTGTTNTVK